MQFPKLHNNTSYSSLGERRGKLDLADFSIDSSWARAVSDSARSRAYPSPPMSGSPPPARRNPDSNDRGHGYGSSGQDVFKGTQTSQPELPGPRGPPLRAYHQEALPPGPLPPYRMGDLPPAHLYHQRPQVAPQLMQQPPHHYRQHQPQVPLPFATPDRLQAGDAPEFSSPKTQRKTKGHVASACVPCKRAHLRCDAQRPCSRCTTNSKEDTCVDVQHKKRGRPRLRDEREQRYEGVNSGFSHPGDNSMRRPLSLYSSESSMNTGFGDAAQRSGSYRVLKSQGGPIAPRFLDHASAADANIFSGPMMPAPRIMPTQEPLCAYLTMEMQVTKVTQSFNEIVGIPGIASRKFHDLVSVADRERVVRLQRIIEEERRQKEPNYLPPIFLKFEEDRVIQSVGFGPEEMGQQRLDHQDFFTFQLPEGQQRTFQARFGLAKKDSTYFIVMVLHVSSAPQTFQQPSMSSYSRESYSRESPYGYQAQQSSFAQSQAPSAFMTNAYADPRGDTMVYRAPVQLGPNIHPSTSIPPFSQAPTRPDYASNQNPYQTPRSELSQALPQSQRQHDLQLPPIRDSHSELAPADSSRRRDDRSNRVDIGGLLESPSTIRVKME